MKKAGNIIQYIKDNSLKIIVKPNCNKNEITGYDDSKEAVKANINAKPESNKANIEVIKFFSKLLKKRVNIIKGLKNKEKVLRIEE
jgi:uncharacterized protein (TIGR00251 family)